MLHSLTIRDIVLIEKLDLAFQDGLCVLTGETGAGKSIILDSLGLALGMRADSGLVRQGAGKGSVTAAFDLPRGHEALALLQDQDIELDGGTLILRRVVSSDGKSRAYINDQPVSVGLLRNLGQALVEVHGQHDDRGLLNAAGHRALLDAYAGLEGKVTALGQAYSDWQELVASWEAEQARLNAIREEEDYDRHALEEIETLGPQLGEEDELAGLRSLMMQGEKAAGELDEIVEMLSAGEGPDAALRASVRRLERLNDKLDGHLEPVIEQLSSAAEQAEEGLNALIRTRQSLDFDADKLDATEERLFALRALARKHRCSVDELVGVQAALQQKLEALDQGGDALKALRHRMDQARNSYVTQVRNLSAARIAAANRMADAVMGELAPLKLENARFEVGVQSLVEEDWGANGGERIEFRVSTNKDTAPGPLIKIASGGELARFILALKVVLSASGSAPTLVFDEVDRGIGGATADAVGERLAALAASAQVLVVTHSPQVAARGAHHWRITKFEMEGDDGLRTHTKVSPLTADERREEIARMLSGAAITDEARAAADQLMKAG